MLSLLESLLSLLHYREEEAAEEADKGEEVEPLDKEIKATDALLESLLALSHCKEEDAGGGTCIIP